MQISFEISSVDGISRNASTEEKGSKLVGGDQGHIWREVGGGLGGVCSRRRIQTEAIEMDAWDLGPSIATHKLFGLKILWLKNEETIVEK